MKQKIASLFWGILLIAAGGIALAQTQGYLTNDGNPYIWMAVFAVVSLLSLVFYFLTGVQNWGMLFPSGIFAALTFLLWMSTSGIDDPAMAAPLFIGIGLPFIVAYLLDRNASWWALIPAGIMTFLTFVLFAVENLGGEVIGAAMFLILAGTFGYIYFTRRVRWAAILAGVLFVMSILPLIATTSRPELAGIIMLSAIALPFFILYLRTPDEKWWALIPAGILGTAGLLAAFILLPGIPGTGFDNRIPNALMYLGIAATFTVIWRRHNKQWAMLVTILAACMAVANIFLQNFQQYWPLLVVVAGFSLLINPRRAKAA